MHCYSDNGQARVSVTPLLGGETYTASTELLDEAVAINSTVNLAGPPDGGEVWIQELYVNTSVLLTLFRGSTSVAAWTGSC